MSAIGLIPCPAQTGHLNCYLALARDLRGAGHDVALLGFPGDRPKVEAEGFEFRLLSGRDLPKWPEFERMEWHVPRMLRRLQEYYEALQTQLRGLRYDELSSSRWSCFVGDGSFGLGTRLLRVLGRRYGVLHTTLPSYHTRSTQNPDWPPMQTTWRPARSRLETWRVGAAWWYRRVLRWQRPWLYPVVRRNEVHLARFWSRLLGEVRVPRAVSAAEWTRPPEFTACPVEFEFPGARSETLTYGEPLVHGMRRDVGQLTLPPGNGPLVLMVFGTNDQLSDRGRLLTLERLLTAAGRLPHVRFLLSVASAVRLSKPLPPNVHRVGFVEQTRLLREASVFVTHGGLNSVKEAILARVPMLMLPGRWDAPGNAARVQYHGLGLIAARAAGVVRLQRQLEELIDGASFRPRLAAMAAAFERRGAEAPIVSVLSELAARSV